MYVYACMNVCVFVYMYVHMCVYVSVYIYVCVYVCGMHVYVCIWNFINKFEVLESIAQHFELHFYG